MMPGMPGGRQLAEGPSSGGLAMAAALFAAYSAVRNGPDPRPGSGPAGPPLRAGVVGKLVPRLSAGAPARAPRAWEAEPRGPVSQTPVKSGSLPIAAQSAAVGGRVTFCAIATEPSVAEASEAATNPNRLLGLLFMRALSRIRIQQPMPG